MNANFLFAAAHCDNGPAHTAPLMQRPETEIDFGEWFHFVRVLNANVAYGPLIRNLSTIWLCSFRFNESGMLDAEHGSLIEELPDLLNRFTARVERSELQTTSQWKRLLPHFLAFARNAAPLMRSDLRDTASADAPFTGSRWDITWDTLVIPSNNPLRMYYRHLEGAPFRIAVTQQGFVNEDGCLGNWCWKQHPGGRLALYIGDHYPIGWAWYTRPDQKEIHVHFYNHTVARAFERMRWLRQSPC